MLALVTMRFLVPACLALIVSLRETEPAARLGSYVTSQPPEVHSPLYHAFGSRCTMAEWRSVMRSPTTMTVPLFSGRSPFA